MFVQHVAMPNSLPNAWGGNLQEKASSSKDKGKRPPQAETLSYAVLSGQFFARTRTPAAVASMPALGACCSKL